MSMPESMSEEMPDPGLAAIAELVHKECGLVISSSKMAMVKSRLRSRLSKLSIQGFDEYCDFVKSENGGEERMEMIAALTTNVSSFFREPHHFEKLENDVLPDLVKKLQGGHKVRFWSAGCSIGAEPYSLAMMCFEYDPIFAKSDFRILATDIDPHVLLTCRNGIYSESQISGVNDRLKGKYFEESSEGNWKIATQLQDVVRFNQLNLLQKWPMQGTFDVIMCRNVVIYFDAETQAKLWPRFSALLNPSGCLFVGHSERVLNAEECGFSAFGTTGYVKG